ncbi:uncharacterized protein CG45076-like [Chenopodium quinoa]|uniref:uncharacterized protein CG45076-like n=1 Tax=Chenopodium quinoa TaxID=63459 RepID=UPI000B77891D|nr:uncharacterized protein CG45076-like [Chenopodium quinoa]
MARSTEEALNMLQSEKTPKRSSATIRKDLAEKAAAELRAKGGEVGKSFEKNLKWAREEAPAILNKIKKSSSASTPGASAGAKTMRIAGRLEKASKIQQLELDLKAADQRVTDAETAKKGAEEAQKKADESAKQAEEALKKTQADLGKLKSKFERLEKDADQTQKNFAATLEVEQNRLVAESDADNDARMKIAWAALYPDADYSIWAMAHSYAEYVVYLREQGEPEPASFEAWLSNNEPTAPELPGPNEAHQIPSDDEEKGENQEAPTASQK